MPPPSLPSPSTIPSEERQSPSPLPAATTSPPPPRRRQVLKRACDACKIRKVKCSETAPCEGCNAVGIACTFKRRQNTRGPRNLRAKTIRIIASAQLELDGEGEGLGFGEEGNVNGRGKQDGRGDEEGDVGKGRSSQKATGQSIPRPPSSAQEQNSKFAGENRIPLNSLVLKLCVYRLRLYPVWPIVAVEEVMASLQTSSSSSQQHQQDMETYALANAVGAATTAQLKLSRSESDSTTGSAMEAECQRVRGLIGQKANLNGVRLAFFLHVYHENLEPGGIKSLLYLREAITLAQVMGLHRESSFAGLPVAEQQSRRRVLWLLFVTERGVAMLHKLPVVMKPNTNFPSMDGNDEANILPAFLKLINLFRIFDQSGAFDILQNSGTDMFNVGDQDGKHISLQMLRRKLQEVSIDWESSNDVQKADICVTRQWMQAVLWKVAIKTGDVASAEEQMTSLSHPVQIAKEFLSAIQKLPNAAIEAHGPSMEYKIFEIASAVTDALLNQPAPGSLPIAFYGSQEQPQSILDQLQRLLASSRGGNKMLAAMLTSKINVIQDRRFPIAVDQSSRIEELDEWLSESTTSPDQLGLEFSMEGTLGPPILTPRLHLATLHGQQQDQNQEQEQRRQQQEAFGRRSPSPGSQHQQQLWLDFTGQQSWSLASSEDLYEQLQSFNGLETGALDRLFAVNNGFDDVGASPVSWR